jgi:TetR/AcrR family transcriptional regulator, transcriptional repressor for nem operon
MLSTAILAWREASMTRYKGDHWDKTHSAIVAAAGRLLRERGFDGTSVGEVMKAVGLTHGGFYAHFEDKTALLVAAVQSALAESPKNFALLARLADEAGDPGLVAQYYLGDERVVNVADGCPGGAFISELQRQAVPVQSAFEAGARATAKALGQTPRFGRDEAEDWAGLSMLMGALSMMRATPDLATREAIRNQAVAAFRKLAR